MGAMSENPYDPPQVKSGPPPLPTVYKAAWLLWIGGSILIVLSWIDAVTPTVGWIGFGVAMFGTVLSLVAHRQQ
jgi:hypothetical protein